MTDFTFYVEDRDFGFRKRLLIMREDGMDQRVFAAPLTFVEYEMGREIETATLDEATLPGLKGSVVKFMQAALDAAWKLGLRPTGAPDPANELRAVRYHLEDMRALAKVPVPPVPREGMKP